MSQPEIFIIESLEFEDERANHFEGRIISQILALSGKTWSSRRLKHRFREAPRNRSLRQSWLRSHSNPGTVGHLLFKRTVQ